MSSRGVRIVCPRPKTHSRNYCCRAKAVSDSVPDQGVLGPVPPGDRDLTGRQPGGTLLPWRWTADFWRMGGRRYRAIAHSILLMLMVLIISTWYNAGASGRWDCGFESYRGHGCLSVVSFVYCRGLCNKLIARPQESYRLWCVFVWDVETSRMRKPWPNGVCRTKTKHTGVVQWSNSVVETSVGEPLISTRPFTVAKCSAWLCKKNVIVFEARSLLALKSATISYFTLLSSSPYNPAHKTHGLHKPSVTIILGRLNKCAEMFAYMTVRPSGEYNGWPVNRQ